MFNAISPPLRSSGGSMMMFILPIIVFVVLSSICYYLNDTTEKKTVDYLKIGTPGLLFAVLVFLFIKFKDTFIHSEPLMTGNYFD
jgi:hypothetical protein